VMSRWVTALAVLMVAAGCSSVTHHGELRPAGSGVAGGALPDMAAHEVLSFGGLAICVTAGAATITAVTPRDASNGFSVQDWGVRKLPNPALGAERKPLASFAGFTHHAVTEPCSANRSAIPAELAVQVTKPNDATATATGFDVHYEVGGRSQSMVVPFTLVLCASTDHAWPCS